MKDKKYLNIKGALLEKEQLEKYLEKIASEHNLQKKSEKNTYPIYRVEENFEYITKTYDLLNKNLKEKINVHPAGEWLLDNYYIIEQTYKTIKKNLSIKKYTNFVGISSGIYKGFARIYVLASEIVAYTDGKIEINELKDLLKAYQNKKTLTMEEIWNINIFFDIALIEKIRNICERIYYSQMQKYRVESIIERLVDNIDNSNRKFKEKIDDENIEQFSSKETFIEYLSYRLRLYGKKGLPYIKILEDEVAKTGNSISEIIKKEHFDVALKKVYIGNCIKSIKDLQRINFTEIFEEINGVEILLKKDPVNVYSKMDHKTKDYYRNIIKELSEKTKISEIYITNQILELAKKNNNIEDKKYNPKKAHVGYYLIDDGKEELENKLGIKKENKINKKNVYISSIVLLTSIIDFTISMCILKKINLLFAIIGLIILYIPISEIVLKIVQYVSSKTIKPKLIPKLYFQKDIPEQYSTMVVIPTILDSRKKVEEMFNDLEVYYLANKSRNIYFTLLGDCTSSNKQAEDFDKEIIETGKKLIKELNEKYKEKDFQKFNFIYRKRTWNAKENCYLGWERKRGILSQFNNFLLGNINNTFLYNSLEGKEIPNIKYIITLDADTKLVLNSAKELIGAMAHILNTPEIDKKRNIVKKGYGIIQPRIGIDIESSNKTLFTKIFAGNGGVDFYSNAISDLYQDNFGEGIFTGKGIYDLETFNKILKDAIPENTVLSHDLLEGLYLKCGLATDIFLFDSYPTSYNNYMSRQNRWIRGDWQIIHWLRKSVKNKNNNKIKNPLGELDQYKILDNLRRSLLEATQLLGLILIVCSQLLFKKYVGLWLIIGSIFIDFIIDILNYIIFKEEGRTKQESFSDNFGTIKGSIIRNIINFINIPYRAYSSIKVIVKTIYRICKSKTHLLEWVTAEEAEVKNKNNLATYFKEMWANILIGLLFVISGIFTTNIIIGIIGVMWVIAPYVDFYISKKISYEQKKISKQGKEELIEIAQRTWNFFEDYLIEENNYLPPDNYQESRDPKVVYRTSSTNIGLALISTISAYDLQFINLEKCLKILENIISTIKELPKWNGHLYNWYDIKKLEPLRPMYVSTVDSGNFIGYVFVTKSFLKNIQNEIKDESNIEKIRLEVQYLEELIADTNFKKLYDKQAGLLSIGFNIEENRLTMSYYDLLASEARQASIIAIAKRDVPPEHWENLSRTLTLMDGKKGLISWSGTAFEYLMPNINIKKYTGSLLDESCKFMLLSQKKYCKKLNIPWGISESAFNLKDLNSNYQYKAFGIPWLGLKRGLADEIVVSSYGSVMALTECPNDVMENIKKLKKYGIYDKYGLYESIDFTPERLGKDKKYEVVKTYMAHHQALILLSINNFINNNIIQKRFHQNKEIEAVDILLQEKMPENVIITKEKKELIEKIKYRGNDNYIIRSINKINDKTNKSNVIANENYMVYFNQDGTGYSKYKNIFINRYKQTDYTNQGIQIYFKNLNTQELWSNYILKDEYNNENYKIEFSPDMNKIVKKVGNIETQIKNIIAPNADVEIRNIKIKNLGNKETIIEVSSIFEPILSTQNQDIAHKAFNNLFLKYEKIEDTLLIKRNKRGNTDEINMAVGLFTKQNEVGELEFEIDKEKLYGRLNEGIPNKIKESKRFSNEIGLVTNPIVALKRKIKIMPGDNVELNLIISINEDKIKTIHKLNKYKNFENTKKAFEISKIRTEEEARYLRISGKDIVVYQKILSYVLGFNQLKKEYLKNIQIKEYPQRDLWKHGISGDIPIILIKVQGENDVYVIKEILKAYEYYLSKNITVDLVILDEETNICEKYIKEEIEKQIYDLGLSYLIGNRIFIIDSKTVKDVNIFDFKANVILDGKLGSLENIISDIEEKCNTRSEKNRRVEILKKETQFYNYNLESMDLKYKNSYGGFSSDGKNYTILVNKNIPSTWTNVLTNGKIGTIVTQNLGGYTWSKNSRLNRITRWSNDELLDMPSESIFIRDYSKNKYWRMGDEKLLATFGFGYSDYEQQTNEIQGRLQVYIPEKDNLKINILKLKNTTTEDKELSIIYKIDDVLGEDELKTNGQIDLRFNKEKDLIVMRNLNTQDINEIVYIYSSEKIESYTGNNDSIQINKKEKLNKENSLWNNTCAAIEIKVNLKGLEEKEISLILGTSEDENNINLDYKEINKCKEELIKTKESWNRLLSKIRVKTPIESIDIMLNGWTMYQTIASRILARSGFQQSGGAYGFRDQLQDCIGVEYLDTKITKNQILKHAKHQFVEGDVEHWWHEETKRGIRTKFSDDRLWLVYLVCDYIEFTNDNSILDEKISYVKGRILKEDEDENYDIHEETELEESLYSHCIRAINVSLKFGKNGLPLIGSGDWNDSLSTVGNKGKGESIWLGFFLYDVLKKFIKIVKQKEDLDLVKAYENIMERLQKALNTKGWDGQWYKRAFMDDGHMLGSAKNKECRIDSIAQSWSIISGAGEEDKKYKALENLEKYLIDDKTGIIKLLAPPFEKTELEPGYIKSYLPGVRENGGQYTHAAVWAIIAFAKLNLQDKAVKYFTMINPIEHSKTKEKQEIYKIEPYVIPADIYGSKNLLRTRRLELVYRFI